MSSPGLPNATKWIGRGLALLLLAASASGASPAQPAGEDRLTADEVPQRPLARRHEAHGLEARVKVLSKMLDLDPRQQSELKKLLQRERERVMEVRSDTSVEPAHRVLATRAIGDETADRIRALLNDEQKKKYTSPRQVHDGASHGPRVEDWMNHGELK